MKLLQYFLRIEIVASLLGLAALTLSSFAVNANTYDYESQERSTLHRALPAGTLGYVRLSGFTNVFSANSHYIKGKQGKEVQQQLDYLKLNAAKKLVDLIPSENQPLVESLLGIFFSHLESPLELAIVPASNPSLPFPQLIMSARLSLTPVQLNTYLDTIAKQYSYVFYLKKIAADGTGALNIANFPLHFKLDKSGDFSFVFGPTSTPKSLVDSFVQAATSSRNLLAAEQKIDANGRGSFIWINTQEIFQALEKFGAQHQLNQLKALGIESLTEVAFGVGRGKDSGGITFTGKFSQPIPALPSVNNTFGFTSVGEPNLLLNLSLADKDIVAYWLKQLDKTTQEFAKDIKKPKKSTLAMLNDVLDINVLNLVSALGPEATLFQDELGYFGAIKIRDKSKFNQLLAAFEKSELYSINKTKYQEKNYYSITLPGLTKLFGTASQKDLVENNKVKASKFNTLFDAGSRFFWAQENDYLIIGSIPQGLIDRASVQSRVNINRWISDVQQLNLQSSLVGLTATGDFLQTKAYTFYLSSLLNLSLMVGANEFDIFAFPTPKQLNFSHSAGMGVQFDANPTSFSLRVSYENSPVDFFSSGGSLAGVAVVGILAAVAIPAYQDYTVRSKVTEAIFKTRVAQDEVERAYANSGSFPAKNDAQKLSALSNFDTFQFYVEADTGNISIEFYGEPTLEGGTVLLTPLVGPQGLRWRCEPREQIPLKYLPASCRSN